MSRLYAIPPTSMGIPTVRRDKLAQRKSYTAGGLATYPEIPTWIGSSTFADDKLVSNPQSGPLAKNSNIVDGEFWVMSDSGVLEAYRIDDPRVPTVTKIANYNWRALASPNEPNNLIMLNSEYGVAIQYIPNDYNVSGQFWTPIRRVGNTFQLGTPQSMLNAVSQAGAGYSYSDMISKVCRFAPDRAAIHIGFYWNTPNPPYRHNIFTFFRYNAGQGLSGIQKVYELYVNSGLSSYNDYGYSGGFLPLSDGRCLYHIGVGDTENRTFYYEDIFSSFQTYQVTIGATNAWNGQGSVREQTNIMCWLYNNYFMGLGTDGAFHVWEAQGTTLLDRGAVASPSGGIGSPAALVRVNSREFIYLSVAGVSGQAGVYSYRRQLGKLNDDFTVTWQTAQDGAPDPLKFKGDSGTTRPRLADFYYYDINNIILLCQNAVGGVYQRHFWNVTRKPAS